MRTAPSVRCAAALVAVLLLGATACSDDMGSSEQPSGALHVAVLLNKSGVVLSGEQRVEPVLEAWADSLNADGGLDGRSVVFDFVDTKGDAATATSAAQEVISSDAVAAISFDANAEGIYGDKLAEAGVPVVGGMGYSPLVWGKLPNWYSVTTNFPSVINAGVVAAQARGAESVSYAVCAEVATCEGIGDVAASAAEFVGLEYTGTLKLAAAAPDFTPECLSLTESETDVVIMGHAADVDLRFAADCSTQGYEGTFAMSGGSIEPAVLTEAGSDVAIDLALNSFPWYADAAAVEAYRTLVNDSGVEEASWADPRSTAAYATAELFELAIIKLADSGAAAIENLSREDVVSAYQDLEGETLGGLLPQPFSLNEDGTQPVGSCYWLGKFEDGEFSGDPLDTVTCDSEELLAPS